ncbi:unnamed protein product [Pneumocystis jirovecii]|uniref:Uncharacterized protein n=1 Tax=Pneumocystis jirovecii TaxID=42068 RepID=L0PCD7_PNEJI|nr:unnamed protein product [Pneumocystis jirovecii]
MKLNPNYNRTLANKIYSTSVAKARLEWVQTLLSWSQNMLELVKLKSNLKTLKNKLKPFPKLNLDLWDTKEIKLKLKNKSRSSIGFKFLQKDDLF